MSTEPKERPIDFSRGVRGKYAAKHLRIVGAGRPAPLSNSTTKAYGVILSGKLLDSAFPSRASARRSLEAELRSDWKSIVNIYDAQIIRVDITAR